MATETVTQSDVVGSGRKRFQKAGEPCPNCDGSDWCHDDQHPTYVMAEVAPQEGKASAEALILHCELYMDDQDLRADFRDCVLPVASNAEVTTTLRKYYDLRRTAPGWNPNRGGYNSHARIEPEALADLLGDGRVRPTQSCERCGRDFMARRKTARYCSETCKQKSKRARTRAA